MKKEWFGGRLRELREKAGLTQTQLADAAGVKRGAIARWERGEREPAWSSVLDLAQALGVSCEAFTEEPAEREASGPGRPRKAEAEPAQETHQEPGKRPSRKKTAEEPAAKPKGRKGK